MEQIAEVEEAADAMKIVLAQCPEGVDDATAAEALTACVGNTVDAIALLWERATPRLKTADPRGQKPEFLDPVAAKWASVRDISDSIQIARHNLTTSRKS